MFSNVKGLYREWDLQYYFERDIQGKTMKLITVL